MAPNFSKVVNRNNALAAAGATAAGLWILLSKRKKNNYRLDRYGSCNVIVVNA
jgi:LPXTG-motif cell wall-anchored protein